MLAFLAIPVSAAAADYSQFRQKFAFSAPGATSLSFDHLYCQLWVANGTSALTIVGFYGDRLDTLDPGLGPITEVSVGTSSILVVDDRNGITEIARDGSTIVRKLKQNTRRRITGVYWDQEKDAIWYVNAADRSLNMVAGGRVRELQRFDFTPTDMDRDLVTETTFVIGDRRAVMLYGNGRAATVSTNSTDPLFLFAETAGHARLPVLAPRDEVIELQDGPDTSDVMTRHPGDYVSSIAIKMIDATFVGVYKSLDFGASIGATRYETSEYRVRRKDVRATSCQTS